jgi:large subunit ribosomal protein L28
VKSLGRSRSSAQREPLEPPRKRRFEVNLVTKRFWLEGEKRWITLKLSTARWRSTRRDLGVVVAELRSQGRKI